jgi:hypothetical protein
VGVSVPVETPRPWSGMSPSDLKQITEFLRLVADTNWPRHDGGAFLLRTASGDVRIPIPAYNPPVASGVARVTSPADDGLTEMQRNILDALAEADAADPPTGEQLARVAGYENSGAFRRALADLIQAGRVVNRRPGYSLPS